jgi:hypothetical protein
MCTPTPVIYPAFRTQTYISTRSALALRRNFSKETCRSPSGLWDMHMSSSHRLYTHCQLPTSLSMTISRVPPCLKAAWALSRSPKRGSNRASYIPFPEIPFLVRHQGLQLQAFAVNSLTRQSPRSLVCPQGKAAVSYRVPFLMNSAAPYEGLSLKARNQKMEKPPFE